MAHRDLAEDPGLGVQASLAINSGRSADAEVIMKALRHHGTRGALSLDGPAMQLLEASFRFHRADFAGMIPFLRNVAAMTSIDFTDLASCAHLAASIDELPMAAEMFGRLPYTPELDGPMQAVVLRRCDAAVRDFDPPKAFPGGRPRIVLAMALWGQRYIAGFERYCLASLLAPGNLPALAEEMDIVLSIVTADRDAQAIRDLPGMAILERYAKVSITAMPLSAVSYKYTILAASMGIAFKRAQKSDADFALLYPDSIVADGSLRMLARMGRTDEHDAMVATAMTTDHTGMDPLLDGRRREDGTLAIPARELVDFGLQHLHPFTRSAIIDLDRFEAPAPWYHLWEAVDGGIAVRLLQPAPVWISRRAWSRRPLPSWSLPDSGWLDRLLTAGVSRIHYNSAPDDYCFVGIADGSETSTTAGHASLEAVAKAIAQFAYGEVLLTPARLHALRHPMAFVGNTSQFVRHPRSRHFADLFEAELERHPVQVIHSVAQVAKPKELPSFQAGVAS